MIIYKKKKGEGGIESDLKLHPLSFNSVTKLIKKQKTNQTKIYLLVFLPLLSIAEEAREEWLFLNQQEFQFLNNVLVNIVF